MRRIAKEDVPGLKRARKKFATLADYQCMLCEFIANNMHKLQYIWED
jgi:hypothetical protein